VVQDVMDTGHDVQFNVSSSYVKNIQGTYVLVSQKRLLCADMDILNTKLFTHKYLDLGSYCKHTY
jgi:ribose 1,5-bisphosphokinase PhnN